MGERWDCHTHNVIPVKTGIQQRAVLPAKDLFRTADAVHWIPAYAGMTMRAVRAPESDLIVILGLAPLTPSNFPLNNPVLNFNRGTENAV